MEFSLRYLRVQLVKAGLWPGSWLARIASFLLGLSVFLFLLEKLLGLFDPSYRYFLGGWIIFLNWVVASLYLPLAYRWLKAKLLWRLRNRLIVTYVFIGVIPAFLLVSMGLITVYFFSGQFANFLVTSELDTRLRSLTVVNSAIANELASRIEHDNFPTAGSLEGLRKRDPASAPRQICAWRGGRPLPLCAGPQGDTPFAFPAFLESHLSAVVQDQQQLYLRAGVSLEVQGQKLVVVSSEPLDRVTLDKIATDLGEITLYAAGPQLQQLRKADQAKSHTDTTVFVDSSGSRGFTLRQGPEGVAVENGRQLLRPITNAGVLPPATGWFDREITFGTPLAVTDWANGKAVDVGALVRVQTRPATLYARLFVLSQFAKSVEYIFTTLGIVLAVIVLLALFIGTRLTRTVTGAVGQLYVATRHINRGDFSHRIPVRSNDQLATLSQSFNSMAESLEKLIEEQKEKQKLQHELVIAQEVQAQLFPRHISQLPTLEVHGFCRPASTVSGDYYDFLTVDPNRMVMAVGDVSGKGISAALLMATIHSAVRAYSLEGIPILREPVVAGGNGPALSSLQGVEVSTGALLTLLNHQLYQSTPAEKYATLFLSYYEGRERRLTYSNAGHLPPIILGPDGSVRRLEQGGTVIGLFDHITYEESSVSLEDGDIFVAYSDGVTEPENDYGEFGDQRLIDLVWENRALPLEQITELVTTAVDDWIGAKAQPDDVTLVLARAR
jgi:phosphoserine phosphatase RsbU/P